MVIELKKIPTKIVIWSIIIYLGLLYFVAGSRDITSFLAYAAVGIIVSEIAAPQVFRWDIKKMFFLGIIISVMYHVIGMAMNEFTVGFGFIFLAAIQQGAVTAIVYKIGGGKR